MPPGYHLFVSHWVRRFILLFSKRSRVITAFGLVPDSGVVALVLRIDFAKLSGRRGPSRGPEDSIVQAHRPERQRTGLQFHQRRQGRGASFLSIRRLVTILQSPA